MKKYNDVHISFTISRDLLPELEAAALRLNCSKGQVARQLVETYMRRQRDARKDEITRIKELAGKWIRNED